MARYVWSFQRFDAHDHDPSFVVGQVQDFFWVLRNLFVAVTSCSRMGQLSFQGSTGRTPLPGRRGEHGGT
eukprot:11193802-Lingulodinium_polyedra.AAC.1